MRANRLLSVVPALLACLPAMAADQSVRLVDRVVPAYGVRHDQPFRMPSRIDPQISQARAYLTQLNAKLLSAGAGAADLTAIATWQQDLAKLTDELIPGISAYERQQLNAVYDELDRAGESIALLTAQVAPAAPKIEVAVPAVVPAVVPEAAPVVEVQAPGVEAPAADMPVEAPVEAPAETPAEAPAEMSVETPADAPADVPVEAPADVPVEAPVMEAGDVTAPAAEVSAPEAVESPVGEAPVAPEAAVGGDAMAPAGDAMAPAEDATAPAVDAMAPSEQ